MEIFRHDNLFGGLSNFGKSLSNEIFIGKLGISPRELQQDSFILLLNLSIKLLNYYNGVRLNLF
jgi:hypothetical protein